MNNDFQDYATPSSAANSLVLQNFIESQCFSHKTQSSFAPLPPMPSGTGDTIHAPANNARHAYKNIHLMIFEYPRGEACLYFSALIPKGLKVCCLQRIALIQRIYCVQRWPRLMSVDVRAGQFERKL